VEELRERPGSAGGNLLPVTTWRREFGRMDGVRICEQLAMEVRTSAGVVLIHPTKMCAMDEFERVRHRGAAKTWVPRLASMEMYC